MSETIVDCGACMEEVKLEDTDICIYCGIRYCFKCEADMNQCVDCKNEGS